ncbi:Yip1-like protein [Panacagrimonas perspica]|uniref:Yip1-like protein n=1 Tax=Panacagrimonas perspica TaxID=381431 RepID=A0A4R7P1A0_9GAMM|nr:YIP1 family protein [Panacagrimonas perspica]TDU26630.1 Yip1-like protein [Panacagrimonas perspica]THD03987.1 hypothetical protein B1810_06920 [Panacagrimonas perspica]
MANLLDRARNILLTPKTEWPLIASETDTVSGLYTRYILILAALPVIASFVKMSLIGTGVPIFGVSIRVGIGLGLVQAVVTYGLSLLSVYVLALIIDALAPTFGGQKNPVQALKTAAYANTAGWVAGIAVVVPWVGGLIALAGSIYAAYLLYLGLPHTMRTPTDKAGGYTAVVFLIAFVLGIVIASIAGAIGGAASMGALSHGSGVEISTDNGTVTIDEGSLGKFEQMAKNMEAAGQKMEDAAKTGDTSAQQAALGEALGTMLGGTDGKTVEALKPEQIKPFVPDELGGLPRTSYNVERNTVMGLQIANGKGSYRDAAGERSLDLEITDTGGMKGLALFAGWALVQTEKESDQGYERVYDDGGMRAHEQWDTSSRSGTFDLIVADRFLVKLQGRGVEMDDIKKAAKSLDLSDLAALKNEGTKP